MVSVSVQRALTLLVLVALLAAASPTPLPGAAAAESPEPVRWMVGFHDYPAGIERGDTWNGATVVHVEPVLRFIAVESDEGLGTRVQDTEVRYIERDQLREPLYTPNDPRYSSQHGPQRIRADVAWDVTRGEEDRVLCIIDTGLRTSHEDLTGARYLGGRDVADGDNNVGDWHGHGTHVAGIATASIDNSKGIAGIAHVPFKIVKVIDSSGRIYVSYVATAMRWCADNGGDVINMSLGGPTATQGERDAATYAHGKGLMLFAASGNDGCNDCILYPAKLPEVIAVGCTTSTDSRCSFSSGGPELELAAPGYQIESTCNGSDTAYCKKSGTSMSSPTAAGAAALIWSRYPHLTNEQMRELLHDTAKDLGSAGRDIAYGYGLVDAGFAIHAVPPDFALEQVYLEDFDDGSADGWTLDGEWRVSSLCGDAASPPNYLGFHFEEECSYDFIKYVHCGIMLRCDYVVGSATTGFDLTDHLQADLVFTHRWETGTSYDYMRVQLSQDGGATWTTLISWGGKDPNQPSWGNVTLPLDEYVGQNVQVRFFFDSYDGDDNDYPGWHIDDVRLLATDNYPPLALAATPEAVRDSDGSGDETVFLDGSDSRDLWDKGTIVDWSWYVGGTRIATGETASVSLPVGKHNVTLVVTDDGGATASDDVTAEVLPNLVPVADAGPAVTVSDADGDGAASVTLDGSGTDADGTIANHTWEWNGTHLGEGATLQVVLPLGTHNVTLTVTDDGGAATSDMTVVTVEPNAHPVADAGPDLSTSDGDSDGFADVQLDGSASGDADGVVVSYTWKLDGGTIATGISPTVSLPLGAHTLDLVVADNGGATDNDTLTVSVGPNLAPSPDAGSPKNVSDPDGDGIALVRLDGSASADPDGTIVSYAWRNDTGLLAETAVADVSLPLGNHTLTLEVTDDGGATDNASVAIQVLPNLAPHAGFASTCARLVCTFNATASDDDGAIVTYAWDFGDGSGTNATAVTVDHAFADAGSYLVCLTVHDALGLTDQVCKTIDVRKVILLERFDGDLSNWTLTGLWHQDSICADAPSRPTYLGYHVAGKCSMYTGTSNAGGAVITVDLGTSGAPVLSVQHRWDTYDRYSMHYQYIQIRQTGTSNWYTLWSVNAYTPDRHDWHTLTLDISPWSGATVDVRFYFDAKTSWSGYNSVPGWHIDGIQVAASAVDLVPFNWDPTSVISGPSVAPDIDGDGKERLSFDASLSTDPENAITGHDWHLDGTQVGNTSVLDVDVPLGEHVLSLTVIDEGGATHTSTSVLNILPNVGPTANAGADLSAGDADGTGSESVTLDGTASSDPDGSIVTYEWIFNGTVVATGATPSVDLPLGTTELTLRVADEANATATDLVTVTITPNRPPLADAGTDRLVSDLDGTGAEAVLLDGSASSDPDGTLVHTWYENGTELGSGAALLVTFDVGTHQVDLVVTDAAGETATDSVQVVVEPNVAPVAVAPADIEVNDDDRDGNETVSLDGRASYDPDGGIVAYEWYLDGALLASGGLVSVTLAPGDHALTLVVRDLANATGTDMSRVVITENRPPVAAVTAQCSDVLCTFDATDSSDPDADTLRFDWTFGDGQEASGINARHAYPHAGRWNACLTAEDPGGLTDTACVQVHLVDTFYEEGFDDGSAEDMRLSGLWRIDGRCTDALSEPYYLGYHNALICNYQTTGATKGNAELYLDLSDGTEAELTFSTKWHVEETGSGIARDFMRIQAQPEGSAAIYTLWARDSRNPQQDWTTYTVDLDPYTGSGVWLRFTFDSANVLYNHYPGWFLDDLKLVGDVPRANEPPTADFDVACHGLSCTFDASGSADDRYVVAHDWDLGDGTRTTGEVVTHEYAAPGTYTVDLAVQDNSGATDRVTQHVTVEEVAPSSPEAAFLYGCDDTNCTFDGTASHDPDGTIASWDWEFGDGNTSSGATTSHSYDGAGNFTVRLTVTDDDGLSNTTEALVSIGWPRPPLAAFSASCDATTCTFDGTASYDPDGTVVSWDWDLGDGTARSGDRIIHTYAAPGEYNVTLLVTDDDGHTDVLTEAVTVTEEAGTGPPEQPPETPHAPDQRTDTVGDRIPVPWLNVESAWFDDDDQDLYVGLKVANIPYSHHSALNVLYRVSFVPTWTPADPTHGGRLSQTERVDRYEVRAHYNEVGSEGSPIIIYDLWALAIDTVTYQGREVRLETLEGSMSTATNIVWWPIDRTLLGAPPPDAELVAPNGMASYAIRGAVTTGGMLADQTGPGDPHTF